MYFCRLFIVFSDGNGVSSVESPILQDFRLYAAELTARHDRHERIVRLSRDVTTESKRVIFFLHSLKYKIFRHLLFKVTNFIVLMIEFSIVEQMIWNLA